MRALTIRRLRKFRGLALREHDNKNGPRHTRRSLARGTSRFSPSGRDRPIDLDAESRGVARECREPRVGSGLQACHLTLARAHTLGDLDLRQSGRTPVRDQLSRKLSAFERGGDSQMNAGVVFCELVDE